MRGTALLRTSATAALAATAVLGFTAGACGRTEAVTPPAPTPIRLGAIYNLTGAQAPADGPALDGARLAVDRINAAGGLLGRRVELLERDGVSDPSLVAAAARGLVEAEVSAIIGLSDSALVLAAAPAAAAGGVPFVTSGASSPRLAAKVPGWLFLACYGDNAQAAAGAEFVSRGLGARTAAVLFAADEPAMKRLAGYFVESFRGFGGAVLRQAPLQTGDAPAQALRRLDPGVVYLAATAADAGAFVRELRAAGYRGVIMGGDGFDSADLRRAAAATVGPVYYTTHSSLGLANATPAMRRFTHWYASAYGRAPENAFACLGFDTVDLLAAAIVAAESADPGDVRGALLATRAFSGVTGTLTYSGVGRTPRKGVTVVRAGSRPVLAAEIVPLRVPEP